ncbi:MAG: tetraacyldisaccharide 4'-kinase [Salinivirgaceae bacterium]|jgi:tetraacyldisaccharide 4'-kinase|nr:tetraacyldisaccharide 4'-kinase [Bacteroidales bacterium]
MRILLFPFSIIYGLIVRVRNFMFDHGIIKSADYNIPTIGVGNITVGGTGKTPHVEYLINLLHKTHNISVLSRGYKRETRGIVEATIDSTSMEIGDEPKQIKQKFPDVSVIVSASRRKAINKIVSGQIGNNPDVIILDDSYQHRYVKTGVTILLIDYNRPIYEDHILPYGRLRESAADINRANIVVVTKSPMDLKPIERRIIYKNLNLYPYQTLLFSSLKYGKLTPLWGNSDSIPDDFNIEDYTVLLLTGIANPALLRKHLENSCNEIIDLRYSDHYKYGDKDIARIETVFEKIEATNKIIITTEKDAVRLKDLQSMKDSTLPVFYIPIEIVFLDNMSEEIDRKIISYVKTNRAQNTLNHTTWYDSFDKL